MAKNDEHFSYRPAEIDDRFIEGMLTDMGHIFHENPMPTGSLVDPSLDGALAEAQIETLEPTRADTSSVPTTKVQGLMDLTEHGYQGVKNV